MTTDALKALEQMSGPPVLRETIRAALIRKEAEYKCPVCGGNRNAHLRCDYPGCVDGR